MPRTRSCIAGVWEPGNIPSSYGVDPTVPVLPTLYPRSRVVANAVGIATVTGVGGSDVGATGSAAGIATVSGVSGADVYLVGSSSGTSAVSGVGGGGIWTPAALGSPLAIWLKGDDLSGSDGDAISAWNDASGNSRNFTQGTGVDQPHLEVAELNSLNVVHFAKANTERLAGSSLSGLSSSASIFRVTKAVSDPGATNVGGPTFFGTAGSNNHETFTDGSIYNGDLSSARKTVGNPSTTLAQWNIIGITSAASDYKYYINGVQFFSTATNTVAFSTTPVIGRGGGVNADWDGYIAEFILVSNVPSSGDREKIEGYLAHKWGITSVLDVSHPYKTDAPTI